MNPIYIKMVLVNLLLYGNLLPIVIYPIALLLIFATRTYQLKNETWADSFATKIGLGKELISAFKKFQELEKQLDKQQNIIRRILRWLFKSHPDTKDRICKIIKYILDNYPEGIKKEILKDEQLRKMCNIKDK